ncbi:YbfB/YjiJ family MFS transporter [Belnapia moabensis]|uniref:YbfB/YjiJ family MFS transporter n=1 Tax=Belnapia moabensis TaxID=365533 RepID=UPI0006949889|nr:YbfB/YjiJ family MFS transporter [Belnapia moabensis]
MSLFLRYALAGAAATASGNGLARFAYVPLFPAMVTAGWVDGGQAGTLGAAALLGYLIGILGGRGIARRLGVPGLLDCGMGLVVLALAACAWNGGFGWFLAWRTLAGIGGGLLMALAGPATQASVVPERRGAAGGIVIAGVGLGIATGAVAVPVLLPAGLPMAWLGLSALALALWAFAHPRWPRMLLTGEAAEAPPRARLLIATYGLHAAGMVPPMVYLADLAARGRGLGLGVGAAIWLVFGLVGVAGGILSGRVTDRIGGRCALAIWLAVQSVALALTLPPWPVLVLPAAAAAGFAAVGVTAVTLTVCREVAGTRATGLWVRCTAVFAVMQTVVGFGLAALFAATGESHLVVFAMGLGFSLAGFAGAVGLLRGSAKLGG